jgi:Domain of unknown function (DUF222)
MEAGAPLFGDAGEAVGVITSGMEFLAGLDCAGLPAEVKAGALKGLERAGALETIARAHLMWSLDKNADYESWGQRSMPAWLVNEAGVTKGEAKAYRTWTRTVLEHPAIAALMADGLITRSWLAKITQVTGKIREDRRGEAEQVIAGLARDGQLGPRDLYRLASEIRDRAPAQNPRDDDPDRGSGDRSLRLELTLDGAGSLTGQLSPECAAAVGSLLRRFAARQGKQDTRTRPQRDHDALLEVCLRLLGTDLSAPVPGGAPVQLTVTTSLADLYELDDGSLLQDIWIDRAAAWFAGQHAADAEAAGGDGSAWLSGDAARGLACDAVLFPVVLGHVDTRHLDDLIGQCVQIDRVMHGDPAGFTADRGAHQARIAELMREIVGTCAKILGGEPGLAAHLRRNLLGRTGLGGASLPLDVGDRDDVPWQIRRAVQLRDGGRCQWPGGCDQPAYASQPHHLTPRAGHGPTAVCNLLTLCWYHHHIAVHKQGWTIRLHGDGTATATSPDGTISRGAARPPPPRPG